jgi:hypothetical protein
VAKDRRRDGEWNVAEGPERLVREGNAQRISADDLDLLDAREHTAEPVDERVVDLDRDHPPGSVRQGVREPTSARTDLHNEVVPCDTDRTDQISRDAVATDEVLPEGRSRREGAPSPGHGTPGTLSWHSYSLEVCRHSSKETAVALGRSPRGCGAIHRPTSAGCATGRKGATVGGPGPSRGGALTDAPLRARYATHPFRIRCLRSELERHLDQHGGVNNRVVGHALVGLLHDIDHGACPRCQGPLTTSAEESPAGSRVTSCRCIPICAQCEAQETKEASIGVVYSLFDWYQDRAVREDVERDLAELDDNQRRSVTDLTSFDDRQHPVG